MSGVSCFIRRAAGLIGVVAAMGLVAAPVALADGDTINAQATVQFSGAVDNPASCNTAGGSALIDWGDNTTDTSGTIGSGNVISGTHTYAKAGTYFGTVTISGPSCFGGSGTTDSFTANVSQAP